VLIECADAANSELLVVEGISAANALRSVRDRRSQAVLAMQGKVPNAIRTSPAKLLRHEQLSALLTEINPTQKAELNLNQCRYQRLIIVADPDVDGQHAAFLLTLFFYLHLPELVAFDKLYLIKTPLFGFYQNDHCVGLAYDPIEARQVRDKHSDGNLDVQRFKGLASLRKSLLQTCLAPDYRERRLLTTAACRDMCQSVIL